MFKMFQCKDVAEEASNYLNKDLPLGKRIGLFMHIMFCSCCRNYLDQIRHTIRTVSTVRPKEQDNTDLTDLAKKLQQISKSDQA